MAQNITDLFEDKARKGEGSFAIAFALMQLAAANEQLAKKVGYLGFDAPGGRDPGALEYVGMKLNSIAEALNCLTVNAAISGSLDVTEN